MDANGRPQLLTLHDYLGVLRRRWLIAVQALILLPVVAVALSLRQEALHEASAQVLLVRDDPTAGLGPGTEQRLVEPQRDASTQARLARVAPVIRRTLAAAGADDLTASEFRARSDARVVGDADILEFVVRHPDPELARVLATEYARQFTRYRAALDNAPLRRALAQVTGQLADLREQGELSSPLATTLLRTEQELQTTQALQPVQAQLVEAARSAVQVQPRTVRNLLGALILGGLLGIALAFGREALDTRVRSADELTEALDTPVLVRLPPPPDDLAEQQRVLMLVRPGARDAEAFRMLRTSFEFANLTRDATTVMITSAVEAEGKSTTAANFAVALARAGQSVALIDLDLRRPTLGRFFRLPHHRGVTDVIAGLADLDDSLAEIELGGVSGSLSVLTAGTPVPNPGELVAARGLDDALAQLAERFDVVLVDTPPLLRVGDPTTISARVDAMIVVARLNSLDRRLLGELQQAVARCPAQRLGLVLTGAERHDAYGYGYGAQDLSALPAATTFSIGPKAAS